MVIALDISEDALKVAVGTSIGSCGYLDLSSQSCKTVLRSHFDEIHSLSVLPRFQFSFKEETEPPKIFREQLSSKKLVENEEKAVGSLLSLGKDNTIRIWN